MRSRPNCSALDRSESIVRAVQASSGRSFGMCQGEFTTAGSQPIRLAVSSARLHSGAVPRRLPGFKRADDRQCANSPDHWPSAASVKRLAQGQSITRGLRDRNRSDKSQIVLELLPPSGQIASQEQEMGVMAMVITTAFEIWVAWEPPCSFCARRFVTGNERVDKTVSPIAIARLRSSRRLRPRDSRSMA